MITVVYPSAIARACSTLDESPVFATLPDGYLRVVARIVKKINLGHLSSPVVASRKTLAKESGKSVETVGRVIAWLEAKGLIQRQQKARVGLRGSSSPIVPTKSLLDALLLTQDSLASVQAEKKEKILSPDEASSGVKADGSISGVPKQSFREQPRNGMFVKIDGKAIPADLVWLVRQQGLKTSGVLALMKLATMAKQRLSDVVSATRQYLTSLRGGALFAYIRALLGKDKDYTFIVRAEARAGAEDQAKRRIDEKRIALLGRQYQTRDGSMIVVVEPGGVLAQIANGRRACCPMNQQFLDAIDEGRLIPLRSDE